MPVYAYKCTSCGSEFDKFLPLSQYKTPQFCECGKLAEKQVTAAAVVPDYAPYTCPVSGKLISGRREHEENLKRHGCRVLEPGESAAAAARSAAEDAALDKAVDATTEEFIAKLPAEKKDKLAAEVEHGVDVAFTRT